MTLAGAIADLFDRQLGDGTADLVRQRLGEMGEECETFRAVARGGALWLDCR